MKKEKQYSGVIIPAVTPLTKELKLDNDAVEKIFNQFHNNHVLPFVLGTTGEAASLSTALKKEFLQLAGRLKKGSDQLYAGISSNVFSESVELAKYAFDNGADVVVATLPTYYALTETAMLRYLEELVEAVAGPLMIYNIPATTHMSIPLNVIETLSHHPHFVGLKDSERKEERMNEALHRWSGREDFSYLLGWAAQSAPALLNGADGLVPSTGNFHPSLYHQLFNAARAGDEATAKQLQQVSDSLGNLYQQGRTLGESLWALKVVMRELGLCNEFVMPPLHPQSKKEESNIIAAWKNLAEKTAVKN